MISDRNSVEIRDIIAQVDELKSTLAGICHGEIDALVFHGLDGVQVYSLNRPDESYRALVEAMGEGAALINENGLITYCNSALVKLVQYTQLTLIGQMLSDFMLDKSALSKIIDAARKTGSITRELELVTRDGHIVPTLMTLSLVKIRDSEGFCVICTDLSSRLRTEALLSSEQLFRGVVEQCSEAIFVLDIQGHVLRANDIARSLCLYEPESKRLVDVLQVGQEDCSPSVSASQVFSQKIESLLASKVAVIQEIMTANDTSTRRVVHLKSTGTVMYGDNGSVIGCVLIMTDISTLKRDQQALLRRKEELQQAVDAGNVGLWTWNITTNEVDFSSKWKEQIGYTETEIPNTFSSWKDRVHPDDIETLDTQLWSCPNPPNSEYSLEFRLLHKDGSYRWILLKAQLITNKQNEPIQMKGANIDITDRKLIEQQLIIAATAFDVQEGIVITDENQKIVRVNRSFQKITGYTLEDVMGQTPHILQSGLHDHDFYDAMWNSINSLGYWQGEIWNRRKNGEVYPEILSITAVKNNKGSVTHYVGTFLDISQRKQSEDKIKQLAYFDQLTQLPNRTLLYDRAKQAFATSARNGQYAVLLFIDLDNFKVLNDTQGHDIGDIMLQQVAQRLSASIREGDTLARLGGDEFVIIQQDLSDKFDVAVEQSQLIGEKILATLCQPFILPNSQPYYGSTSIGMTLFKGHQSPVDDLIKQADIAMYKAKAEGKNAFRLFDESMQNILTRRVTLDRALREAIEKSQFVLFYQPQIDNSGCVLGAEVLIRWDHPETGMISPAEFIPLSEEIGLIEPIGHWVLKTACLQLTEWAKVPATRQLSLAVNVSAIQFGMKDFVEQVKDVLKSTGAPPNNLKLELTESLLIANADSVISKMIALKKLGVSFALDDFGTGYSSLSYLKKLPLSQLKIDQSFVRDILVDANDAAIARTIITLAHSLGLTVIAEGVETTEQRNFLDSNGCKHFQGYLFGKPMPIEQFESILNHKQ